MFWAFNQGNEESKFDRQIGYSDNGNTGFILLLIGAGIMIFIGIAMLSNNARSNEEMFTSIEKNLVSLKAEILELEAQLH